MVYFFLICLSIIEFCPFYFSFAKTFYCFLLLPDKCQCIRFVSVFVAVAKIRIVSTFFVLFLFWPGNLLIFITTDLFLFMQIKARHADLVCMLTTQVDCLHNKKVDQNPKNKIQISNSKTFVLLAQHTGKKWGVSAC